MFISSHFISLSLARRDSGARGVRVGGRFPGQGCAVSPRVQRGPAAQLAGLRDAPGIQCGMRQDGGVKRSSRQTARHLVRTKVSNEASFGELHTKSIQNIIPQHNGDAFIVFVKFSRPRWTKKKGDAAQNICLKPTATFVSYLKPTATLVGRHTLVRPNRSLPGPAWCDNAGMLTASPELDRLDHKLSPDSRLNVALKNLWHGRTAPRTTVSPLTEQRGRRQGTLRVCRPPPHANIT